MQLYSHFHCYITACVIVVYRTLESLHRKELDNNRLLRQQLSSVQSTVRQLNDAQKEAATLRKKVTELQNVQSVINGENLGCFSHKILCSFGYTIQYSTRTYNVCIVNR